MRHGLLVLLFEIQYNDQFEIRSREFDW